MLIPGELFDDGVESVSLHVRKEESVLTVRVKVVMEGDALMHGRDDLVSRDVLVANPDVLEVVIARSLQEVVQHAAANRSRRCVHGLWTCDVCAWKNGRGERG